MQQIPLVFSIHGVGGLSVLHEIRRALPGEDLLYVADSAHAPYGDKSQQFIEDRSIAITEFLVSRNAKAIVVACNHGNRRGDNNVALKVLHADYCDGACVKPASREFQIRRYRRSGDQQDLG
ncbi:glutamate racemase [Methylobacter tundripaludum]|uniref:glutamate racemase n=1 Tax=Methylobacter tundripaludum TaxID=173365 RepID=UPI000ADE5D60|nr:hypothetical protein [Methylobacter tundripaludum]